MTGKLLAYGPPSWAEYRKRRRIFVASLFPAAAGPFLWMLADFRGEIPVIAASLIAMLLANLHLASRRCPRCNDYFHHPWLERLFRRQCIHCGPPRYVALPDVCTHCGYSLMGNLSARCPECGTVASRRPRVVGQGWTRACDRRKSN